MPLFRCLNCNAEFEAPRAACAACELDAANPRDADYLMPLVTVHFDPPTKVAGRGKNHPACDPKLRGAVMTGEPSAVTCAACKASEAFAAAGGASNGIAPALFARKG